MGSKKPEPPPYDSHGMYRAVNPPPPRAPMDPHTIRGTPPKGVFTPEFGPLGHRGPDAIDRKAREMDFKWAAMSFLALLALDTVFIFGVAYVNHITSGMDIGKAEWWHVPARVSCILPGAILAALTIASIMQMADASEDDNE